MGKRIAVFIDTFYPMIDGVITVADRYCRILTERGYDVTAFVPYGKDKKYRDEFPYKVVRCHAARFPLLFGFDYVLPTPRLDLRFRRWITRAEFDLVHIHSPFGIGKTGIRAAKKHGVPAVATMHSQYKMDFEKSATKPLAAHLLKNTVRRFDSCDLRFTVNKKMREIYRDYGVKNEIVVLPNATDMPRSEKCRAPEVDAQFGIEEGDAVLLFVGRLSDLKNIFLIADALKAVRHPFRMIFVGDGTDRDALEKRIKKAGIGDLVTFTGTVKDRALLRKFYNRADLFLFPSMYDANSLVQIEAASQGTPTLFLRGAATMGDAEEGLDCFASDGSPEAYAAAIDEILADPDRLRRVGDAARERLVVTWEEAADRLEKQYDLLLSQKK